MNDLVARHPALCSNCAYRIRKRITLMTGFVQTEDHCCEKCGNISDIGIVRIDETAEELAMRKHYVLLKTVPSLCHNAPFSRALGHHWPVGQKFTKLPQSRQRWYGSVAYEQIGGEETIVLVDVGKEQELFGEDAVN